MSVISTGKSEKIIFHLKREGWGMKDIYGEFKSGRKDYERRKSTPYWRKVLAGKKRAWLVTGYPRGSLPRLEADIDRIEEHAGLFDGHRGYFDVYVKNLVEVKSDTVEEKSQ